MQRHLTIRKAVLFWYDQNGRNLPWRKAETGAYERIVSELLLRRTKVRIVCEIYPLFFSRFPTWESLAAARVPSIAAIIRPLGIWKSRPRQISELAKEVVKSGKRLPDSREELESRAGVGHYVASAVLIFEYGKAEALIDVNMARVINRYFDRPMAVDLRRDKELHKLAKKCIDPKRPMETNWALLDIGSLVCTANNPRCNSCPLYRGCTTRRQSFI